MSGDVNEKMKKNVKNGLQMSEQGNYKEALDQFRSVLSEYQTNVDDREPADQGDDADFYHFLLLQCGICSYYLGKNRKEKYEDSLRYLSEVTDDEEMAAPNAFSLQARYFRAVCQMGGYGDYQRAADDLAILCRTIAKTQTKDKTNATLSFNIANGQNSLYPEYDMTELFYRALNALGTCHRKRKEFTEAVRCFDKALEGREDEGTKVNLGIVKRKSGDYKGAVQIFENVLQYNPKNVDAHNNLGVCYIELAWFDKAWECFLQALEIEPANAYAMFHLGLYYHRQKDYERAIERYDQVIQRYPNYYKAIYCRADCWNWLRNYGQALKGMREVLRLRPDDVKASADIGWCLENMGEYEEAIRCYEKALLVLPREESVNSSRYISTLNNIGSCYYRRGKYDDAISYFKKALQLKPDDAYSLYNIGDCYHFLQNRHEEFYYYEQALSVAPVHSMARNNFLHARSHYICALVDAFRNDRKTQWRDRILQTWLRGSKQELKEYSQEALLAMAGFLTEAAVDHQQLLADAHFMKLEDGFDFFESILRHESVKDLDVREKGQLMALFLLIYADVAQIKKLYAISATRVEAAHYTKTERVQSILEGKLRLANAAYMNDPSEGEAFLELLTGPKGETAKKIMEPYYPDFGMSEEKTAGRKVIKQSNIYLLSLTKSADTIPMWVTYGDDGKGCCFVFDAEFFDVREEPVPGADVSDSPHGGGNAPKYVLYEVQYIRKDEEKDPQNDATNATDKLKKAKEYIAGIYSKMEKLEQYFAELTDLFDNEKRNICRSFVVNMLDQIRFLFKTDEYEHEREVRLIKFSDQPLMDKDSSDFPQLYIEMNRTLSFKEAILGPKITDSARLVQYLYHTKKVVKVTQSAIRYR